MRAVGRYELKYYLNDYHVSSTYVSCIFVSALLKLKVLFTDLPCVSRGTNRPIAHISGPGIAGPGADTCRM